MIDDGNAVHYAAVERGTPVYGYDGVEVGKVDEVVDNYREHILDGIVIEAPDRELRFVDGPEVARTAERGVTLSTYAYGGSTTGKPYSGDPTNGTNQKFTNNVFQRGANRKCGSYGPVTSFNKNGTGNVWSGNVWDDGTSVASAM